MPSRYRFDRREFLRLSSLTVLAGQASAALGGEDDLVPSIQQRVRILAEHAPLAMQFRGSTADDCRRWQSEFSEKLRALLGPHRPPAKWASVLERRVVLEDHIREERVLTSEGLPPLPVHLLLPRNGRPGETEAVGRRPGVLAIHGHGRFGYDAVVGRDDTPSLRKEISGANYDYGRQLVRRGYVVAAPCLTPFGRRRAESGRESPTSDACGATFVSLQLLGRLLIAENLRDILWAFAALAGHEAVDPDRIGCVGLSYGGRMTMLTTALEPRIRVAVISGALNCLQERVATGHSAGCQAIPGLLAFGDVPEIASLIAPRPCLWEVGARDGLIAPDWAENALTHIRRAYHAYGADDRLRVDRFDGHHEWHGTVAYPLLEEVLKP